MLGAAVKNAEGVVAAIESYSAWSAPWSFVTSVSAALASGQESQDLLEQVWSAACHPSIWAEADSLASGAAAAERALGHAYPWLSGLARRQLAKAAAYQWR